MTHVHCCAFIGNIRFIYGKPDVPKASPEIIAEVNSELADLQRDGDWYAAVEFVVKAGDPKARSLAANDWYRLRRSLEIIKVVYDVLSDIYLIKMHLSDAPSRTISLFGNTYCTNYILNVNFILMNDIFHGHDLIT